MSTSPSWVAGRRSEDDLVTVEADRSGQPGLRDRLVLVEPPVAQRAVIGGLVAEHASDEVHVAAELRDQGMTVNTLFAPEQVMAYAVDGLLSKHALASLLTAEGRRPFFNACAAIELKYTDDCRALGDPCLEAGCSCEGERCLQPLLRAGIDYYKACGVEWAKLFTVPANREPSWRSTLTAYQVA